MKTVPASMQDFSNRTAKWSKKDHDLYMSVVTVLMEETAWSTAWGWARHIVNTNKYNKENKDEAK